jgi:hypothetical protein
MIIPGVIKMASERVTITLPAETVREIDQRDRNRSRFILEAVQQELERRRREELRQSLIAPHPESREVEALGLGEWLHRIPVEDVDGLLDPRGGTPVRWVEQQGWIEVTDANRARDGRGSRPGSDARPRAARGSPGHRRQRS